MAKTLYQNTAEVDVEIHALSQTIRLDLDTKVWNTTLKRLSNLIQKYFDLCGLCETEPLKVAGYNVQPNASDSAMWAHELARRIVCEVRSPGPDDEKVVKVALMIRGEPTFRT
jgi:hypothetical protein